MIEQYGADSVRWFILSDSPPEKDVQWSATGVASSNKFLQKIWNLVIQIITRKEKKINKKISEKFNLDVDVLSYKIDKAIEEFKFNVAIAHFYEIYKIFVKNIDLETSNVTLNNNITKVLKLMIPFTPHLARECLEKLNCKDPNKWPMIKENFLENIKFAIQVNGKTRDIIEVKKGLNEETINSIVVEVSKANKFIKDNKILKKIFVKDKIINYIIKK